MSIQILPSSETALPSVPTFELQFAPVRPTVLEFPLRDAEGKDGYHGVQSASGCLRGIQSALAIEAAAALVVYGTWQLVHLLR